MEERHQGRSPAFDFDEWSKLAAEDPEGFELKRRKLVDDFIASASPRLRKRLEQLQWRIDMERKRCKNPMTSCMKLYDMMWDFVRADRGFIYAVNLLEEISQGRTPEPREKGVLQTRVLSIHQCGQQAGVLQ